jgi:hypothetical protein
MAEKEGSRTTHENEGEGNKTAAREYNQSQRRFARSDAVEQKAKEAGKALNGPEKKALKEAEAIGKRHSAGEDPAITR